MDINNSQHTGNEGPGSNDPVSPNDSKDSLPLLPERPTILAKKGGAVLFRQALENGTTGKDEALVFEMRNDIGERTRALQINFPSADVVAKLIELFNGKSPEQFEAKFEGYYEAKHLVQSATEPPATSSKRALYEDYYPSDALTIEEVPHHKGSVVTVIQAADQQKKAIVIAASDDEDSEQLIIRIPNDRWNDKCSDIVSQLGRAEDAAIRELVGRLKEYADSPPAIFSDNRRPTAAIINSMIAIARESFSGTLSVEKRGDRSAQETAERLLERRACLMVRFREGQSNVSMWKKMFVTAADDGHGFLLLCVGRKDSGQVVPNSGQTDHTLQTHGRARYDFDLSDLDPEGKQRWMVTLFTEFARSREEFPGAITEYLGQQSALTTDGGNERVRLAHVSGMKKEHLNALKAVADFRETITRAFTPLGITTQCIKEDPGAAALECQNSKGDVITITIKPHGIDSIFVAPRTNDEASGSTGALFSLSNIYQFSDYFPVFVSQLGVCFRDENGKTSVFRGRNNAHTGLIGAQNVLHFINGATTPQADFTKPTQLPPRFDAVQKPRF